MLEYSIGELRAALEPKDAQLAAMRQRLEVGGVPCRGGRGRPAAAAAAAAGGCSSCEALLPGPDPCAFTKHTRSNTLAQEMEGLVGEVGRAHSGAALELEGRKAREAGLQREIARQRGALAEAAHRIKCAWSGG